MPSTVPFFEKAEHVLAKLRASCADSPRLAAFKLGLWSWEKALVGHITGDVAYTRARDSAMPPLAFGVILRGGIGDEVMSLAFIHELVGLSGVPCKVDIFSACPVGVMQSICFGLPHIKHVHALKERIALDRYDIVLDVLRHAQVKALCENSVRTHASDLHAYLQKLIRFQRGHATWYSDENQAMGIHYADVMGTFRRGQADFDASLGLKDSAFTLQSRLGFADVARRFSLRPGYVTLQREAGACAHSLKLWSAAKYASLLERLCHEHPSTQFVVLGMDKNFDAPDSEQVIDLRGLTGFDEFMALVRHARLHIGCEGVVPHLRHYLRGGPSLVLYGPSCARMLSYPENSALSGAECPNGCEGILFSWQETCLKGYACCRSLEEITVEQVARRVGEMLDTACSAELPERRIPDPGAAGAPTPSAPGDA